MAKVVLADTDTRAPGHLDKKEIKEKTSRLLEELAELQNLLYAEGRRAVLVVIQGMDASGKDGLIQGVFSGMNPLGISAKAYKAPTSEEQSHDFLWRIHRHAPAKGMIQVFNRSHYEDVLVPKVHKWCSDDTIKKRMEAINDFERLLQEHNETHILKCYLHVSQAEQLDRLTERLSNPAKMWKYNNKDFEEAQLRDEYIKVYEECFKRCDQPEWIIVPADQNWYKEYVVAQALRDLLKGLPMKYPDTKKEQ